MPANNVRRLQILFDFESIVDMKLGLIQFMQEMFESAKENPDTLSKIDIIRLYSDEYMDLDKLKLIHMYGAQDPVKVLFRGQGLANYDSLMEQFYTECYEGIMNRAPMTGMVRLIRNYQLNSDNVGGVKPLILCTSDMQETYCKKYVQKVPIVRAEDRKSVDLSNYGSMVIPYLETLIDFGFKVDFTNIFALNYRENFEDTDPTVPLSKYTLVYGDSNGFSFYDAYPEIQPPVG